MNLSNFINTSLSANIFYLILVLLLLNYLKKKILQRTKQSSKYHYSKKNYFMTQAEHEFYNVLNELVGTEFVIFAQVHLPTIVNHKVKGQNWQGALSHINRKSVDFVLCNKSNLSPVLAIELDDKSHQKQDRQYRDAEVERILSLAEMPLLRVKNQSSFDKIYLHTSIREKLNYK